MAYSLTHARHFVPSVPRRRGWAANSSSERVRLKANADQLEQQIALLREQIRIKDARNSRIPTNQRPQ